MNTGDLVNNPGDAVQDSIYKANLSILGKLPYWALPGNHDIMGYSQEKRDDYLAKRGYDRFSFVHKGWAFLGIDSNCIKDYTESDEAEQFGWLEAQLRASEGRKGIVVFFHHPVIRKDMDEPEEYFNFETTSRGFLLAARGSGRENRTLLNNAQLAQVERTKQLASVVGDFICWGMSIRIPASIFGIDSFENIQLRGNLYKCADKAKTPHYLSAFPIKTEKPDFHRPEFFDILV